MDVTIRALPDRTTSRQPNVSLLLWIRSNGVFRQARLMTFFSARIAALIHRLSDGRFGEPVGHHRLQSLRRSLQKQGLPGQLTRALEDILDDVAGKLLHIDAVDRGAILATVCNGLVTLARTGQQNPDLLRNYAITKAQELLRDKSVR